MLLAQTVKLVRSELGFPSTLLWQDRKRCILSGVDEYVAAGKKKRIGVIFGVS
jgi:hypothetical protein